jgi:quercetin dioxygenase-like cupin family protein
MREVMKRGKFILTALAIFPLTTFSKITDKIIIRTNKGFKVNSGEARFGGHYKMKGVTLNVLDSKISSNDTDGGLAVFEQNGFTPKGGPPLHIHPYQDEFFYIIEGEYLFQVGEDKYQMKSGDTIFLPRNIQHAFIQLTEKGKVIVSYIPAGKMEDFFKTTDSWISPPTMKEIEKTFEDHDMKVVGPPLKVD